MSMCAVSGRIELYRWLTGMVSAWKTAPEVGEKEKEREEKREKRGRRRERGGPRAVRGQGRGLHLGALVSFETREGRAGLHSSLPLLSLFLSPILSLHCGGSIAFVNHDERLKIKFGREPTIVESFNRTHKTKQGTGGYVDKRSEAIMTKYSAEYSKKYGDASTSNAPPCDYDLWFEATGGPTHGHVYGFSPLEDLTGIIGQSSSSCTSTSQAPELYTREDLLRTLEHEKKKWQEEVLQKMREEIGFGPRHADQGSNGDSGSADHASL